MIGFARKSATSLRGRGCIPSIPGNLSVRRFFNAFVTSSCVTENCCRGGVNCSLGGLSVNTEWYCSFRVSAISLAEFVNVQCEKK